MLTPKPLFLAIQQHINKTLPDTDLYALFRVEKLLPGERVDITWKVIPKPKK